MFYIWLSDKNQFVNKDNQLESAFGSREDVDLIVKDRALLFESLQDANSYCDDHNIRVCVFLEI